MSELSAVELRVDDQTFQFEINTKYVQMGSVPIKQVWMDTRTLYNPRPGTSGNSMAIVDCFWALCRQGGTTGDPSVQESYLLARLLPYSRQYGARRIVPDSRFGHGGKGLYDPTPKGAVGKLEAMLVEERTNVCDAETFRQKTADILGVPRLDESTQRFYAEFCENLFELPRRLLASGDTKGAVSSLLQKWESAMRVWGRRRGKAEEKRVLDVLSYECRAAFHRCYSAVWLELLRENGPLQSGHGLGVPDMCFLCLWHLDHNWSSGRSDANCHLFHGHIPSLHPAFSLLVQTQAGRELIGNYISCEPEAKRLEAFAKLLHAALLAVYIYMDKRELLAEERRSALPMDPEQLERLKEERVDRHKGKTRHGRK